MIMVWGHKNYSSITKATNLNPAGDSTRNVFEAMGAASDNLGD